MLMDRFVDTGTPLGDFLDEVWVRCPRCDGPACVTTPQPYWSSTPRFVCPACTLQFQGRGTRWYGGWRGTAAAACRQCGTTVARSVDANSNAATTFDMRCTACGTLTTEPVTWRQRPAGEAHDPAFGLPMLLQAPCAGHVLWACNARHLDLLAAYTAASLRQRSLGHNSSIASRLPQWIKDANNRDAVLRTIERLRAELP